MNIYQTFLKLSSFDDYDDWQVFAPEFVEIIKTDSNLVDLLSRHTFILDKWNENDFELSAAIEEEILWLKYSDSLILDEASLLNSIVNIADNIVKASLLSIVADNRPDPDGLPPMYPFLEDAQIARNGPETTDAAEGLSPYDSDLLHDLEAIQRETRGFNLHKTFLLEKLKTWDSNESVERPIVKRIPIIKQLDYFDPAAYVLIKNNPELLRTMEWRIFEEMLADILKTFGYSVELTRKTKDGGIDVIAIKSESDFGLHKYILQAKRYTNSVQVSPVRELLYLHHQQKASKSCLATTSSFTKGAWKEAEQHRWTLELKDKEGILSWIDKAIQIKRP